MQKNWEIKILVTDKSTKVEGKCANKRNSDLTNSTIIQLVSFDDFYHHFDVSFLYPPAMTRMDSNNLKISKCLF